MSSMAMGRSRTSGSALLGAGVLALVLASGDAEASVRREGTWPEGEGKVSLDATAMPRAQAMRKLADAAGWSVVWSGAPTDAIDLHVVDQPPDKALELLLADGTWVAKRDGKLVSIARDSDGGAASEPGAPPPATERGKDRVISGGSLTVAKDEVVHDVAVFGGSVDVWGTATGDVAVFGGSARIHDGARVQGDASAIGGSLILEDGSRVDGDVSALGGKLERGDKATVGGDVAGEALPSRISVFAS